MYKRHIINTLFIISFPIYGLGTFIAPQSPSVGFMVSCLPHLLIILFYCVDVLYKRTVQARVNILYILMVVFLLSSIVSLFVAFGKDLPEMTFRQVATRSILLLAPFHSFVIMMLYQKGEGEFVKLTLIGLSILLFINLIGNVAFGLTNPTHSIEGQLSFPFLDAFYSGASLIAIINLMLLYYLYKNYTSPLTFTTLSIYFISNLFLFYLINSRLVTLIFLLIFCMVIFRVVRVKGVFLVSLFTLPILLSSGLILYEILRHPTFASLLQRVDVEDVTTFHGRAYLWKDGIDWLLYDQRGLLLGNGYKGHYFIDMIPDVVKMWNARYSHHLHLHSTSLEILVCQGIFFFLIYCTIFYRTYMYFKRRHKKNRIDGALFPVVIFLLFMVQVDTFLYLDSFGAVIFALLVARAATAKRPVKMASPIRIEDYYKPEKLPQYDLYSSAGA